MSLVYKWNDDSTYIFGNPPKAYNKGDIVPVHIFQPHIWKQHLSYGRIIQVKPELIPPVSLSISVMAHPSRASFFPRLREKLGDIPFAIDDGCGLIENCKRAWRLHDMDSDFAVVIQDDAIICHNFKERAIKFITEHESERRAYDRPVCGYNFFIRQEYPHEKMREFEKQGYYMEGRNRGGVAICLPTNQIEDMLKFFDTIDNRHDDERISQWIIARHYQMCFPIPSLIDHDDHNTSIAGNRPAVIREAWKFIDNEKNVIPKIIHQLWVGPKLAPLEWMKTWKEKNQGYLYRLWTEKEIKAEKWENQKLIDYYMERGIWHGVKDVCQYEILYNNGGVFVDADMECVNAINELFTDEYDSYSFWENERVRPGFIQPLLAAVKGSTFAKELIDGLKLVDVNKDAEPWRVTGNKYVGEMYKKTKGQVKIFPSHYFSPAHFTGEKYPGADKIYALHHYGSTVQGTYEKGVE